MKLKLISTLSQDSALVFALKEGGKLNAHPLFKLLKESDRDYLSALCEKTPVKAGQSRLVFLPSAQNAVIVGVAPSQKFTYRQALLAARRAVAFARGERLKSITVLLKDFCGKGKRERDVAGSIATQFVIANFEFTAHKTPPPEGWPSLENALVFSKTRRASIARALERGVVIGEEINEARVLANTPGGDMTPQALAEAAVKSGKRCGFNVSVLDEKQIRDLRMGGIVGVSKGSAERPKFIVMEYLRGRKSEAPVVMVGKGVTFDTGGLNLKPQEGIAEMHMDMSGGAAVIHVIAALARLKTKKNIIGLVPAVENMPSGSSYHPGDILKTMSGKTIEVLNTDAEGRIILADALEYARKYKPRLVIDIATLTGAAMVALGQRVSALFSTDKKIERSLREAGEETGDFVWPLPLWEEYEDDVKGTFGDVANIGKTKYGGAINGAVFLWQFIKNASDKDSRSENHLPRGAGQATQWVHIDIAPRMTSIEGEYLAKGAAGASIALLARFLSRF